MATDKQNLRTINRGPLVIEVYRVPDYDQSPRDDDPDRYAGVPDDERQRYEQQDKERAEAFDKGEWCYMGVVCDIRIITATRWAVPHKVGSASVWGIESDSEENYFTETENDMIAEAQADLQRTIEALDTVRAELKA